MSFSPNNPSMHGTACRKAASSFWLEVVPVILIECLIVISDHRQDIWNILKLLMSPVLILKFIAMPWLPSPFMRALANLRQHATSIWTWCWTERHAQKLGPMLFFFNIFYSTYHYVNHHYHLNYDNYHCHYCSTCSHQIMIFFTTIQHYIPTVLPCFACVMHIRIDKYT